jgi:hypothetical protein
MTQGRDYSHYYWHLFVERGVRPASELMLAWVASCTGLTTLQSFMPLILSFYATLLSVTSGLALHAAVAADRPAACALLVFSSMTTLGSGSTSCSPSAGAVRARHLRGGPSSWGRPTG